MSDQEAWYQVTAPHFCCGIKSGTNEKITEAAPILKWSIGKHIKWFKFYCKKKGWTILKLDS